MTGHDVDLSGFCRRCGLSAGDIAAGEGSFWGHKPSECLDEAQAKIVTAISHIRRAPKPRPPIHDDGLWP